MTKRGSARDRMISGPCGPLLDRLHIAADALADLVFLGGHALAVGQQGFIFAQVHQHIRTVKAADGAADDVPDAVFELGENQLLFRPADVHHQRLLGILRGDPAESDRGHFHFQFLAHLRVGLDPAGIKNRESGRAWK